MNWTSRRKVPLLLAAAIAVPIAAVSWLAWSVVRQDRVIDAQRRQDALRGSTAQIALAVEGALARLEEQLVQNHHVRFDSDSPHPGTIGGLLYRPESRPFQELLPDGFRAAEALEFQQNDPSAAAAAYRQLALSHDLPVRAAALAQLGALHRKQGDRPAALRVYQDLQRLGSIDVDGQPAELIARQARCRMFEISGDRPQLQEETAELARVLYSGRIPVDQTTFGFYADLLKDWGAPAPPASEVDRTAAAVDLWRMQQARALSASGRRFIRGGQSSVLAIWMTTPDGMFARLIVARELEQIFSPLWTVQRLDVSLFDLDGNRLLGSEARDGVALSPGETHLPFVIRAGYGADWRDGEQLAGRRWLFGIGLTLTVALMLAAAYGLSRATAKEMALVRQQSDFVSAVSHEFRTPLTSMRHLTELLATNSVQDETRRATYYRLLARQTERLHHMVESLLNYNRIQAGAYAWRLEPIRVDELVRTVVDDFRNDSRATGRDIGYESETILPAVDTDREALGRAVSNLLENAVKYSSTGTPVRVSVRQAGTGVEIAVEDRGIGIPREEQRRLFDRFVRGAHATQAGIGGIGIGLALVKSVAEAHGGAVRLESESGRGSIFTIALPPAAHRPPNVQLQTADVTHPHR